MPRISLTGEPELDHDITPVIDQYGVVIRCAWNCGQTCHNAIAVNKTPESSFRCQGVVTVSHRFAAVVDGKGVALCEPRQHAKILYASAGPDRSSNLLLTCRVGGCNDAENLAPIIDIQPPTPSTLNGRRELRHAAGLVNDWYESLFRRGKGPYHGAVVADIPGNESRLRHDASVGEAHIGLSARSGQNKRHE